MPIAWNKLDLAAAEARARWDAFCLEPPGAATLFHSSAWARLLVRVYGATCLSRFQAAADGRISRLLPLFAVRTVMGQRRLVSIPHAPYGGLLPGVTSDLLAAALPPPGALPAPLKLRCPDPEPADTAQLTPDERITMWLDLPSSAEPLWNGFNAKVRNQVRKAEKEGVTVAAGRAELLPDFHTLYSRRMHELGTPAHSLAFFEALLAEFAGAEILVARHDDEPVGALLDVEWGGWRVNLYGASVFAQRALCANPLAYWTSLRRAVEHGRTRYDFSRSKFASGQYEFKRQWGAVPHRIHEFSARRTSSGAWQLQPAAPELANPWLPRLWQRLPFPVAAWLSKRLRRYVF